MKTRLGYKFINVLIVLLLIVSLGFFTRSPVKAADPVVSVTVTPSDTTPTVGDTITVSISIDMSASGGQALGSYTGTLEWDPAVLSYENIAGAPPTGFVGFNNTSSIATGKITFNGAKATGATGSVVVLVATFDVIGSGAADLTLAFSPMSAATSFGNLLLILSITQANVIASPVPCYALTLTHTGSGANPVASPSNSTGCSTGSYTAGQVISLTGAVPNSGWQIAAWTGTNNNGSTASTNSLTMPASAHTASVTYTQIPPACYALTLSHTGNGSNPVASPANSSGCTAGQYTSGQAISLTGAVPASGWQIASWTGTNNNSSTASTNTITMPASAHTASVTYTQIPPACYALTLSHTGNGTNPTASPANSSGCTAGQYTSGQAISLTGAVADSGWHIAAWTGTDNNGSTASTNNVTMPANAHAASVIYVSQNFIYLPLIVKGE